MNLKILITCIDFINYTGSEIYIFELSKELKKLGNEVTIVSNIGNPLMSEAKKFNLRLVNLSDIDSIKHENFDILHLNHSHISKIVLNKFPSTPAVMTIHSEILDLERPLITSRIKKYIAIRPKIKSFLMERFSIPEELISLIYNPFDFNRFNKKPLNEEKRKKRIIFIGTLEHLRKNSILDLVSFTKENYELWICGKKHLNYIDDILIKNPHVKYFNVTSNPEKLIQQCDETAGILLGRTTIEGWLCGKSGWIYDIDKDGNIKSKELLPPPEDLYKFDSKIVSKEIEKLYTEIINKFNPK